MPMETVTVSLCPATGAEGAATDCRIRSARMTAPPSEVSGRSTANSSPPSLPTRSISSRSAAEIRSATVRMTMSPTTWP